MTFFGKVPRAKGEAVVEQMVKDMLAEIDALAVVPVAVGSPRSPLERQSHSL